MHTEQAGLGRRILTEVASWPGVQFLNRPDGTVAFAIGSLEIGGLRQGPSAQFSFPTEVWSDLVGPEEDCVSPTEDGCGGRSVENETDVREVIELLRLSYGREVTRAPERAESGAGPVPRSGWRGVPGFSSCCRS